MTEEAFGQWYTVRTEPSDVWSGSLPAFEGTGILMGQVTCPSGCIVVIDLSLGVLDFAFEAVQPLQQSAVIRQIIRAAAGAASTHGGAGGAVVIGGLPRDRALGVYGIRRPANPAGVLWQWVYLDIQPDGAIARTDYLSSIVSYYGQLMFSDVLALHEWHQIESIDGKADLLIWGRDEASFARGVGAPQYADNTGRANYGWLDVPVEDAEEREQELDALARECGRAVRVGASPHSHAYYMGQQMGSTEVQAGMITVGGALVCGLHADCSWREFPVFRDLDRDGRLVRIRVYLDLDE
jgi:hypothetical protein